MVLDAASDRRLQIREIVTDRLDKKVVLRLEVAVKRATSESNFAHHILRARADATLLLQVRERLL